MKNSSFIEFFIFFCFVAFIGAMMNMEANLEDNSLVSDMENKDNMFNLFEDRIEWENRLDRLSPVGTVAHDSKPETNLFDIVLTATFQDGNNDDLVYSWEHLNSWNNANERNNFDSPISFTPNNSSSTVECQVVAGIHEFQVTVTDTYGEETSEVVSIEVGSEENAAPNGRVSVVKRAPGCMDEKALNFNGNANSDDGSCEYPLPPTVDPFGGDMTRIKAFQTAYGLTSDGQWGPTSQAKYEELKKSEEGK